MIVVPFTSFATKEIKFFGERHQIVIIRIGLIELQHGELGVVLGADAFVAEVAVDLVDAVEAADDQALEVQLRRDAQKEVHIEGVVVGGEGPRRRAAGDLLHHRRFDFEIAATVKELAQGLESLSALDEDFAGVEIGEEVHVTLAVAQLDVGQAVKFFRQGEHGLGQEGERLDVDGQLIGPRAEEVAGDADVVAHVEELVEGKGLVADSVLADVDLQALAALLERGEAGLALGADGHDASRDGDGHAWGFQRLGGLASSHWARTAGMRCCRQEAVGIGRLAQLHDLLQLFLAQLEEVLLEFRIVKHVGFLCVNRVAAQ